MTTRYDPPAPSCCELCNGSGWIDCTDDRRHRPTCKNRDSCYCHALDPCRCTRGNRARNTATRLADDETLFNSQEP